MSLHITQSITTQQENGRRINTLGFHASVRSLCLSSLLLLLSLSLQAPVDKSTLCANKINLYSSVFFSTQPITTRHSEKVKKKKNKALNFGIVLHFLFISRRALGAGSDSVLRLMLRLRGKHFVCVHFNDINSIQPGIP